MGRARLEDDEDVESCKIEDEVVEVCHKVEISRTDICIASLRDP
jgi:hypothetical protein